jgi:hypothetical protein
VRVKPVTSIMSSIPVQSVSSSGFHNLLEFYLCIVFQNIIPDFEIFNVFLKMGGQGARRHTSLRQARDIVFKILNYF